MFVSVRTKLIVWYLASFIAIQTISGVFVYQTFKTSLTKETIETSHSAAEHAKQYIETEKVSDNGPIKDKLASVIHQIRDEFGDPELHIEIVLPDRSVIHSGNSNHVSLEDPSMFARAIPNGDGYVIAPQKGGGELTAYSMPINRGDKTFGFIHVYHDMDFIESALARLRNYISLGIALSIFMAVASFFIMRHILSPIGAIDHAAKQVAEGNLSSRIVLRGRPDELHRLACTFNHMLDQLECSLERQKRFVADASHKLRTPLSIIKGNINLTKRWGSQEREVSKTALDEIDRQVFEMSRLASSLLAMAKVDAESPVLKQKVELDDLVTSVVRETSALNYGPKISITELAPVVIECDRDMIREVLMVLIDNALKHTPEDGSISVKVCDGKDTVKVSVIDTGSGISPKHLPHVFDRFYQGDKPLKNRSNGSGLGLSIALSMVKQHGGDIKVESTVGVGSTFTVILPKPASYT
ncbi:MAG: HAMP domain-containing histidine kinase [Chloroflexi bacterium]|nr:HAMP domain-containing histidine kinase [Chloroflexota bacterium]